MSTSPRVRKDLPAITGVRFLLAAWVVALHMFTANAVFRSDALRLPHSLLEGVMNGGSAVSVFFVLSGFVLAYSYPLDKPWPGKRVWSFMLARVARIYPVYALALLLAVPSVLAAAHKAGTLQSVWVPLRMLPNFFLLQAWFPTDAQFWGGPTWSLSVEAFFYATFPFLGRALWRMRRLGWQVVTVFALSAVIVGISYAASYHRAVAADLAATPEPSWLGFIKYDPLIRLPEFLAGIVLCHIFVELQPRFSSRGYWFYLPGLACTLLLASHGDWLPSLVRKDGLLLPATAATLLGLGLGGGWLATWLSTGSMKLLGRASYALYLLHMPVYAYFAAAGKRLSHAAPVADAEFVLYLLTILAASVLCHVWVEEPARLAILRRWGSRRAERIEPPLMAADPM